MVPAAGPRDAARPLRRDDPVLAEVAWLAAWGVTLVVDIGANAGQSGRKFRRAGYPGRIVSFEPVAEAFAALSAAAAADPLWQARRAALGARDGTAAIGVSENLVSSSLRAATPALIAIHAPVRYARHEEVPLARLDGLFDSLAEPSDRVHLKIDTQGSEREVIAGARGCLARIGSVRMEVAVSEVYEGEMLVPEAILAMDALGYVLVEAWPAWRHPATGEVLHFDLLFRRRDLPAVPRS